MIMGYVEGEICVFVVEIQIMKLDMIYEILEFKREILGNIYENLGFIELLLFVKCIDSEWQFWVY